MDKGIFRKKSVDKLQSPENLNDYLRVSNPGMWLLLAAIVILLVGTCIWGIFGEINSSAPAVAQVDGGQIICYVEDEYIPRVETGMKVLLEDREGTVSGIRLDDVIGYEITVTMEEPPKDGYYLAEIILDSEHPVSFVLN